MSVAEDYIRHVDAQIGLAEGFAIDDDSKADWALRKIAQAEHNKAERAAFVKAEIERLQAWQSEQDGRDEQTIDRMTQLLEPYYWQLRESGAMGKSKTYKLPNGQLTARASQPQFERDETTLLPWARERGLTKIEERTDWATLKKRIAVTDGGTVVDRETGEIVAGVVLGEDAGERFGVKVEGE